jgi:ubiquinone/menaquinone biosynthesis C-methylase UbiE
MVPVDTTRMRDFWDDRAREDALYFVDNREPYRHADADRFWRKGEEDLATLLGTLGLAVRGTDHVLDVGCGVGRLTRVLARDAAHVTALDVSPEMLAKAQELNPQLGNVEWVLGDGETLTGIEDASVDAVVSHVVLQHIPSAKIQLGYITEFGRVLKPGGWAAFGLSTDPRVHEPRKAAPSKQQSRRGFLKALVGQTPSGQDEPEWLGAFVPLDALGATATQAGLVLEQIEGSGTQFTLVRAVKE